jgi:hypothetical protein
MGLPVFQKFRQGQIPEPEVVRAKEGGLPSQDLPKLPEVEPGKAAVVLPPEGGDGRGADLDRPVVLDGEVNSQKGLPQVRDGIDVGPDRPVFPDRAVVLQREALEGEDGGVGGESEVPGDAVGIKAGAIDDGPEGKGLLPLPSGRDRVGPEPFLVRGPVEEPDPGRNEVGFEGPADGGRVDGRRVGRPEGDAAGSGVGLDFREVLFVDDGDIDAVSVAPGLELENALGVSFVLRDDDLSAVVRRQFFLPAVLPPETIAVPGEPGLERIAGVVEAGVKDAAVSLSSVFPRALSLNQCVLTLSVFLRSRPLDIAHLSVQICPNKGGSSVGESRSMPWHIPVQSSHLDPLHHRSRGRRRGVVRTEWSPLGVSYCVAKRSVGMLKHGIYRKQLLERERATLHSLSLGDGIVD